MLTSDVKARDQFAPSSGNPSAGSEVKRQKLPDPPNRCRYCGVPGHKIAECRTRMRTKRQENPRRQERSRPAVSSKVSCFKCREEGHIAPNCPLLRKTNRDSDNERQVNSCVVEFPTGKLSHLGDSFSFYFDSGAECSLIRESIMAELIMAEIIRPSNLPFASPMLLVKKDGSDRLRVDFQELNKNTVADRHPNRGPNREVAKGEILH